MIIKQPAAFDTSYYELILDFAAVSPRPALVCTKATEGSGIRDSKFLTYWVDLKQDGIRRACYHFHRKAIDAVLQALNFINAVKAGGVDPQDYFVLDIEEGGETPLQIIAWLDKVEQNFPNTIMLYSTANLLSQLAAKCTPVQLTRLKKYPLWIAWYPLNPDDFSALPASFYPAGLGPVWMWQYSESALVPGIVGEVDANWLSPTFRAILGTDTPAPLDVMTTPHDGIMHVSGTRYGWRFELFKVDPAKVLYEVNTTTPALETVSAATQRKGATLGINGSDWDRIGAVISPVGRPSFIVTNTDSVLISDKPQTNVKGLVTGLRFIVVGGTLPVYLFGAEAQYTEGHARSIHGLTADGKHLILQSEGIHPSLTVFDGLLLKEAAEIMVQYGAVTAFDSGGGGDVACILDGQSLIVPENINQATGAHFERPLPQTLLIYTRGLTMPNGTAKNISGSASAVRVKPSRYAADSGKPRPVNGAVIEFVKIADAVVSGPLDLPTDKWLQLPDGNFVNHILNGVPFYTVLTQPTPDPVTPPVPAADKMTLTVTEAGVTKTYSIEGKITVS